jgi:hypothetical protein
MMRSAITSAHLVFRHARLVGWFGRGVQVLKALGPYAAIELLLPGGSLFALLLWFARQRRTQAQLRAPGKCWPATEAASPRQRGGILEPATARAAL